MYGEHHRHCATLRCSADALGCAANELAQNENTHIAVLRAVLGSAAVPCPAIELNASFASAANAALGAQLNPPFR